MKIEMTETRDVPGFGILSAGTEIDHPEGGALVANGVAKPAKKKNEDKPALS